MIAFLLACALFPLSGQDRQASVPQYMTETDGPPHLMILPNHDPISPPKLAPIKGADPALDLNFPYVVAGFENEDRITAADGNFHIRFRVFSQSRETQTSLATPIARMLMRLWQMTYTRLDIDHAPIFSGGIVDVYLCKGGRPGGEQLFGEDIEGGRVKKVNTIYIYDVASLTDHVEQAREVAHEYGHAILPGIGGFVRPERWANGYLGEKLFLTWIHEELASGRLSSQDSMGATAEDLQPWLDANVKPLVKASAMLRPDTAMLARKDQVGMNAYLGLAMSVATMYPTKVFARSMKLTGSASAKDYPAAIALATEEPDIFAVKVPPYLAGTKIWLPLGKAKVSGCTTIKRDGNWTLVQSGAHPILVKPVKPNQ